MMMIPPATEMIGHVALLLFDEAENGVIWTQSDMLLPLILSS